MGQAKWGKPYGTGSLMWLKCSSMLPEAQNYTSQCVSPSLALYVTMFLLFCLGCWAVAHGGVIPVHLEKQNKTNAMTNRTMQGHFLNLRYNWVTSDVPEPSNPLSIHASLFFSHVNKCTVGVGSTSKGFPVCSCIYVRVYMWQNSFQGHPYH